MKISPSCSWLKLMAVCLVAIFIGTPVFAKTQSQKDDLDELREMSEQFDQVDKRDFQATIDRANECTRARNFSCSENELIKAAKVARSGQDKKILAAARQNVTDEKARIAEENARIAAEEARQREYEAEKERRRAEAEAEAEVSSAAMFAGMINAWNTAEAKDQKMRADYADAMARATAAGEAKRRLREEAEKIERRRREDAAEKSESGRNRYGDGIQSSAHAPINGKQEEGSGGAVLRTDSSKTTGVYSSVQSAPRARNCTFEPPKEATFIFRDRDQSKARARILNDAKFSCIAQGGYKVLDESCESKALHKPEIINGKITIKENGAEWICRVKVICNKPREKCVSTPTGASSQ